MSASLCFFPSREAENKIPTLKCFREEKKKKVARALLLGDWEIMAKVRQLANVLATFF